MRSYTRVRRVVSDNNLGTIMPKKETIERARRDRQEGKSASTQAGEFVREEIESIHKREHGARSTKAGNCHWPFEGKAGWREIAGS